MTKGGDDRRRFVALTAAMLGALVLSLAWVASAAAEGGDSAPVRPVSEGGFGVPATPGPTSPEEYPLRFELGPELTMRQVDETEVAVEYVGGPIAWVLHAPLEHDLVGANVPTTLRPSEGDVVTIVVHHRAGNPLAGGAPFAYPVTGGAGWEGGFYSVGFEMNEPKPPAVPAPAEPTAAAKCTVPRLGGLSLHAAKARLRAGDCSLGRVVLAAGVTAGRGQVIKQFRPSGSELAAGAPVGLKLGPR